MSDTPVLIAETRTEFGKGASRRARRAAKVPAVLYGHGADPVHIDLPGHDLFLIVRGTKNALVELKVDGKSQLALVKEVQVHPVSRNLLHADFLAVKAGEKVDVEVPVVVDGESAPGTAHTIEEFTILVKASATAIPEDLKVSIEGLEAGGSLRVRFDLRTHVGSERFSDRTRHSGCPLEAGVDLDAIRLTLSAGASIKSVGRQLIATVANVRARSIDEAGGSPAVKAGGVSEKFGLGGAT